MTAIVGTSGVVKIGANAVAEVTAFSIDEQAEVVEDTPLGETAKTFIPDRTSWSGSISCQWDATDTNGQEAMTAGSSVSVSLQPEGDTTGDVTYSGTVLITGISRSVSAGAVVTAEFSFQGSGDLTQGTAT
jgi:flagellar hook assembly protein FlgD